MDQSSLKEFDKEDNSNYSPVPEQDYSTKQSTNSVPIVDTPYKEIQSEDNIHYLSNKIINGLEDYCLPYLYLTCFWFVLICSIINFRNSIIY